MSKLQQGTDPGNAGVVEPQANSGGTSAAAGYTVGYKRPPVHSRFKPGQSGNPNGRPPGSANAKTTVQRVMNEKVSVRRGQKTNTVSTLEALVQAHAVKAIKGDPRSAAMVINVMTRTGLLADKEDDGPLETAKRAALADKARSSDALFENIDAELLSKDEMIELSRLAAIIDLGGDVTALSTADFQRLKQLVNKGRGIDVAQLANTTSRELSHEHPID
jgi:Family of unknown function (DUF5681)